MGAHVLLTLLLYVAIGHWKSVQHNDSLTINVTFLSIVCKCRIDIVHADFYLSLLHGFDHSDNVLSPLVTCG